MTRERPCETCGVTVNDGTVFVYALPGIPISVGNCVECHRQGAYPLWVVEANTEAIGGLIDAADWWKEAITYKDGKYVTVQEAFA